MFASYSGGRGYSDGIGQGNWEEQGFVGYLPKPYGIEELGKMLAAVLGTQQVLAEG